MPRMIQGCTADEATGMLLEYRDIIEKFCLREPWCSLLLSWLAWLLHSTTSLSRN